MSDTSEMVMVFGSNEQGKHNGGAARDANQQHGAVYGQGFGPQGKSFAIPTCSRSTGEPDFTIDPEKLRYYVYAFILYAKMQAVLNPSVQFKVTRIGTGLAGWADSVVAPLFAEAPENCFIDEAWKPWLPNHKTWGTYGGVVITTTAGTATTGHEVKPPTNTNLPGPIDPPRPPRDRSVR